MKLEKVIAKRQFLLGYLRQEILFALTKAIRTVIPYPAGITVGEGTRVQRLRCLRAEGPLARISVGRKGIVYENARVEAYGEGSIFIGDNCILGDVRICSRERVTFGNRVITSWNVFIQDYDSHPLLPELRKSQVLRMTEGQAYQGTSEDFCPSAPIVVGDDVWIGANVTILKGATIGAGSTVAAGAVVTGKAYPPRSVIAGNPARVVKELP